MCVGGGTIKGITSVHVTRPYLAQYSPNDLLYLKVTYFHRSIFVCDFTVQLIFLVLNSANSCSSCNACTWF